MTNANKIRTMSNNELAEFIRNHDDSCACCALDFDSYECNAKSCKEGILEWLESERDNNKQGSK